MAKSEELKPIHEVKTKKQILRFYERKNRTTVFTLGEHDKDKSYIQFVTGEDEEIYHENLVNHAYHLNPKAKDYLILGGGDGLAARNIRRLNKRANITIIEIDGELIEYFKNNLWLSELNEYSLFRCIIIIGDARKEIDNIDLYDIIICDFPDATNDEFKKLYSKEFYTRICSHLKDNGIISIQSHFDKRKEISRKIRKILGNSTIKNFYLPYLEEASVIIGVNK